jgi:hypothetical protein
MTLLMKFVTIASDTCLLFSPDGARAVEQSYNPCVFAVVWQGRGAVLWLFIDLNHVSTLLKARRGPTKPRNSQPQYFGEDTMRMLWEVMYQNPDRQAREAAEAKERARARALLEAEAEAEAETRRRSEEEEKDLYLDMLSRALDEEGEGSEVDDDEYTARSYRRIEAQRARKEALQKGGFFGLDEDSESELLGGGSLREEDLYGQGGGETEVDDDDSTLQMLIDQISKSKQGAGPRGGGRGRGVALSPLGRGEEGTSTRGEPRGRSSKGEESGDEGFGLPAARGRGRATSTRGMRQSQAAQVERSGEMDDMGELLLDASFTGDLGQEESTGLAGTSGEGQAETKPKRRGRPKKEVSVADGVGAEPLGMPPPLPKPKRTRRKPAARKSAEASSSEPTDSSGFG